MIVKVIFLACHTIYVTCKLHIESSFSLFLPQKELQNLEDACDEMLMVEDESLVPYPFFNTRMQLKWKY